MCFHGINNTKISKILYISAKTFSRIMSSIQNGFLQFFYWNNSIFFHCKSCSRKKVRHGYNPPPSHHNKRSMKKVQARWKKSGRGMGGRVGMKHTKEISTFINIKSLIFFTLFLNSSKVLGPLLVFPWRAFSTCSRTTSNTFLKSSLINTCLILCFLYLSL